MIYFTLYAQSKEMLLRDTIPGSFGVKTFAAGAIAGTVAAAVTCPIGNIDNENVNRTANRTEWNGMASINIHGRSGGHTCCIVMSFHV